MRLRSRWFTQPTVTPRAKKTLFGGIVEFVCMPGVSLRNLASNVAATISGSPSGDLISDGRYGRELQFHPGGSTNGYGTLHFGGDGADRDFVMLWAGTPDNISSANGQLITHGADGSGSGWNAVLGYLNSNSLRVSIVDASPAQNNVDLSISGLATGSHERVALRKSGTTLVAYDWKTRGSASGSAGNGTLRDSTLGAIFASGNSGAAAGHNRAAIGIVLRGSYTDAQVWALLDDPWMVVESYGPRRVLQSAGGGGGGVLAGTADMVFGAGSSTLTGSGALAGTAANVFGAGSSTLRGAGALAGSAALVFGGTNVLGGAGALAGSAALVFGGTNALTGSGALAGACPITITPTGTLVGAGALAGTAAMVFDGTLSRAGDVTGSAAITITPTGTLTGAGALAGSAALVFGGTNTLAGSGALTGSTAIVFGGSLTPNTGAAAGSAAMQFSVTGTLSGGGASTGAGRSRKRQRERYIARFKGQDTEFSTLEDLEEFVREAQATPKTKTKAPRRQIKIRLTDEFAEEIAVITDFPSNISNVSPGKALEQIRVLEARLEQISRQDEEDEEILLWLM